MQSLSEDCPKISPSVCLRDSAHALHLRHTTQCVLQRVLSDRLCIPERIIGILFSVDSISPIVQNVNTKTNSLCIKYASFTIFNFFKFVCKISFPIGIV